MNGRQSIVVVEPMHLSDIPQVVAIDRASFSNPWPPTAFSYELRKNQTSHFFVAREAQPPSPWYKWWQRINPRNIIGFVGYWLVVDEAHISTIAVRPDHRGQHIGEKLLRVMLRDALERGAAEATLEVRVSNYIAQSLYRKYGFENVGRRKGYYRDNHEDALLMSVRPITVAVNNIELHKEA